MAEMGVGIIGTGWVAGEHIAAYERNPHTRVVALCDLTEEAARAKAAACGIECAVYTDYKQMLARDDIQIVSVTSPPNFHPEHAIAAVRAGKHLLLEKPMALNIDDARAIRDAVAEAGVKSLVGFVLRWNPLYQLVKTQLAQNAIGRVFFGEVDYFHGVGPWYGQYTWNVKKSMGGSSLLSAGCHAVDGLRWFMGGDVAEVTQYATFGQGPDFKEYEYNPSSVTILRFTDGRIGKVASCIECVQPYVFRINLVGTHGTILNNRIFSKTMYPGQTSWAEVPTILPDSGDVTHHPFTGEVEHLVDSILSGEDVHCNVEDAYKSHEVVFAADRSGEEGRPVTLPLP
ncbi:MAG: Gfo/Idh/MocA family oxidoreductase [Candidatus Hydrogenedentes bacterium]|nr:Gfo/Idh/MocA family oxidoreductase [Candidatus Hydrogenedentota bacterium]